MQNIIGKRVRQARENHIPRLTQEQLAARLQVLGWEIERSGVGKIESGIRQITDIEVSRLSEALGVSVAWLFDEVIE